MSKPKENSEIRLRCETCGQSHLTMKLGELKKKLPELGELKESEYLHGMCDRCKQDLEAGSTFFKDRAGRCVKVTAEASREKISAEFRGKVLLVPKAAMDVLITSYLEAHPGPVK